MPQSCSLGNAREFLQHAELFRLGIQFEYSFQLPHIESHYTNSSQCSSVSSYLAHTSGSSSLTSTKVCPLCSNCLTVSRSSNHTNEFPLGQNRLECRTCPYQFLIDKKYYERKEMKRKEVEDVMGGANAWENVDKADGMFDLSLGVWWGWGCTEIW